MNEDVLERMVTLMEKFEETLELYSKVFIIHNEQLNKLEKRIEKLEEKKP